MSAVPRGEIYTNYTNAGIFLNPAANILCNQIVSKAGEIIEDGAYIHVLLTGTPAKIVQGQEPVEVECIPFITNNLDLFRYYQEHIHEAVEVISSRFYKTVLQIETPVALLEIWYKEMELSIIDIGVHSQEAGQIPPEIK